MLADEAQGILVLKTPRSAKPLLSLGCAWELEPVNVEPMDEDQVTALSAQHAAIFHGLPVGSTVQFLMTILPSTSAPAWEKLREHLPPHAMLDAQRAHIATGLPHSAGTMRARLRTIHTLVTVRSPLVQTSPRLGTIAQILSHPGQSARHSYLAQLQWALAEVLPSFRGIQNSVEDTLQNCGHTVTRLDGGSLGSALARAVDPYAKPPLILPEYSLGQQVLQGETETTVGGWRYGYTDPDTNEFQETYRNQVLSLCQIPLRTYPGIFSSPRVPRDASDPKPMALWDAWDGPLTLAVNALVVDQASEDARLEWQGRIAGFQAKLSVRNREIKKAIDAVVEHRFVAQETMACARIHLVLWGTKDTLPHGVEEVQRAAARMQITFATEPRLGATLFPQTLPLGCDATFPPEWTLRRTKRFELSNFLDCLPVYAGFRGTGTASVHYLNRRGESVGVDLYDNVTNAHGIVFGTSGGGKTYTTACFVNQVLPLGDKVILLDPLRNYRALCAFWDGTYIRMNFETPPCINPFYGDMTTTHVAFQAAILNEMAGNDVERLTWEDFNVLQDALSYFAQTRDHSQGEATLSEFVKGVLIPGSFTAKTDRAARRIADKIARCLGLFYGRGMHARFVDGKNTFAFGERLTVIEFEQLGQAQELQAILFFALLHLLPQQFQASEWRLVRKYLIADELWALLKYRATAEVIEKIILTYRNIATSVMFLSQLAKHFQSPTGQVIRGIADTTLMLQQKPSEFAEVASTFGLTVDEQVLFKQVRRHATWNTGYLRMSNTPGGLIRILGDPLTDLLMSQEKSLRQEREAVLDANPGAEHPAILDWLRTKGVSYV
jgi:hypothetical protein